MNRSFFSWFGKAFRQAPSSPLAEDSPLLPSKGLPFETRFLAALEKGYAQARAVLDFADAQSDQLSSLPMAVSSILKAPQDLLSKDQKACLLFCLLTKGFQATSEDLQKCLELLTKDKRVYFEYSLKTIQEERFFYAIINACMDQGMSPHVTLAACDGNAMVFWFAWQKHWAMVSHLLDKGAEPNAQNVKGQTLLHMVCKALNEEVSPFDCFYSVFDSAFSRKLEGFAAMAESVPLQEMDEAAMFERLLPLTDATLKTQAGETVFSLSSPGYRAKILQAHPDLVLEGACRVGDAQVTLAGEALLRLDHALLEKLLKQNPQALVTPDAMGRLPTWTFWHIDHAKYMCDVIDFLKSQGAWKTTVEHVTPAGETFLTYGLSLEKQRFLSEKYNQLPLKLERLTTELPTHAWVEVAPNGESASFWLHGLETHVSGLVETYVHPRRAAILEASLQHVAREFGPPRARF
jgi:hypothetical protein